jgi:hypothetical protein
MIRSRSRKVAVAAAATVTLLAVPFAASAFAEGDAPKPREAAVDAVRARCDAAVDQRLATLDRLSAQVKGAVRVPDGDKQALLATIDATRTGLTGLRAEIDGDTELGALRTDCRRIVDDHRVYVLLAPQVRLTLGADLAQQAVGTLDQAIAKLDQAIADAAATGKDVTDATARLDDAKAQRAAAETLAEGVIDAISPLTPADYNAGTAQPVLAKARTDLKTAVGDLRTARNDVRTIRDDLH